MSSTHIDMHVHSHLPVPTLLLAKVTSNEQHTHRHARALTLTHIQGPWQTRTDACCDKSSALTHHTRACALTLLQTHTGPMSNKERRILNQKQGTNTDKHEHSHLHIHRVHDRRGAAYADRSSTLTQIITCTHTCTHTYRVHDRQRATCCIWSSALTQMCMRTHTYTHRVHDRQGARHDAREDIARALQGCSFSKGLRAKCHRSVKPDWGGYPYGCSFLVC